MPTEVKIDTVGWRVEGDEASLVGPAQVTVRGVYRKHAERPHEAVVVVQVGGCELAVRLAPVDFERAAALFGEDR